MCSAVLDGSGQFVRVWEALDGSSRVWAAMAALGAFGLSVRSWAALGGYGQF